MASIFGIAPKSVQINYEAHPGQAEISDAIAENFLSDDPAALIELICSRGWGKTLWLVCDVLVPFLEQNPGASVMWVAPTLQVAMTPVDDVFKGINELTGDRYVPEMDYEGHRIWEFVTTKSGPILKWHNGATVFFKSADAPESIVSKGYNRIILDEAALIDQRVFNLQIMGTARKQGIKIFLITTPRGKKHWTYAMFLKGQDPSDKMHLSFQQPYTKNPYFNTTQMALMKNLPEWVVRQEYYAEFLDEGDSVIKGLNDILVGEEISFPGSQQEWCKEITDTTVIGIDGKPAKRLASDRRFIVGMDIAKSVDYTVINVMDTETGEVVYYKRVNKMDYRNVLDLAARVCKQYNDAELIFDSTGVGGGLSDMLQNYDIVSHPYVFTNESKNDLINRLILSIEYCEISIPNIVTIRNELSAFTYTITKTGKISYAAPPGFHDDIVVSLALSNWFRKMNYSTENVGVLDEILDWNSGPKTRSFLEQMEDDND